MADPFPRAAARISVEAGAPGEEEDPDDAPPGPIKKESEESKKKQMKITKSQLKQIIKEELENVLSERFYGHDQDNATGLQHAKAFDTHKDTSYDNDPLRDAETSFSTRGFSADDPELIALAKELALRAGSIDGVSYYWKDFIDKAKRELILVGLNR